MQAQQPLQNTRTLTCDTHNHTNVTHSHIHVHIDTQIHTHTHTSTHTNTCTHAHTLLSYQITSLSQGGHYGVGWSKACRLVLKRCKSIKKKILLFASKKGLFTSTGSHFVICLLRSAAILWFKPASICSYHLRARIIHGSAELQRRGGSQVHFAEVNLW